MPASQPSAPTAERPTELPSEAAIAAAAGAAAVGAGAAVAAAKEAPALETVVAAAAPPPTAADKEARNWAAFCHLAGLAGFVFPFGNIVGPLILWQLKKNEMPFVDQEGKEALNFQISLTIYAIVSIILIVVVIGFLLLMIVGIGGLILSILAAIKASNGEPYRYPLTIRLVK